MKHVYRDKDLGHIEFDLPDDIQSQMMPELSFMWHLKSTGNDEAYTFVWLKTRSGPSKLDDLIKYYAEFLAMKSKRDKEFTENFNA